MKYYAFRIVFSVKRYSIDFMDTINIINQAIPMIYQFFQNFEPLLKSDAQ